MIKIISYREYLDKFQVKKVTDKTHMNEPWEAKSIPDLFLHIEEYLSVIPESERYDLHYTLANVYYGREFKDQTTLAIDIDEADLDQMQAYWNIISECTGLPREVFGVVKSGGGFHFLWNLETPFAKNKEELKEYRKYYQMLCAKIQSYILEAGIGGKVDNQIIRATGTLRLPLTENRKYDPPRKAELIKRDIATISWDIRDHVTGFKKDDITLAPSELRKFPSPDAEFIKEECRFIKWNFEHPEDVDYNSWFAALSIVSKFKNGREEAHAMSQGHNSYSFDDTELRFEQASLQGPRTCENIDTLSDKCKICPHYQSITSPVQLQGPNFIKSMDTGFWEVAIDSKGELKRIKPDYEGLKRYFEQKYNYRTSEDQSIYIFNGKYWSPMADVYINEFAEQQFNPSVLTSQIYEFRSKLSRSNTLPQGWFGDSVSRRINLQNGVLNLETMLLEPHDTKFGFLSVLPYEFSSMAKCPTFDKFMKDITCNRQELEDVLMEFAGYAFSGMEFITAKALILSGEGANGKSTFINILKALAGKDFYSSVLLNELSSDNKRAMIVGKLFNVAEETPKKGLDDSSAFKQLSGGGDFTIKKLYKDTIYVTNNRCKLIMACNEMPRSSDLSEGLFRRLMIVPFDAQFKEGINADTQIEKKLLQELPGILNRVIEGYHRLVKNGGFSKSGIVKDQVDQFRSSQDSVRAWVDENVSESKEEDTFVASSELYMKYKVWAQNMGFYPVNVTVFGTSMGKIFGKSFLKKIKGRPLRGYRVDIDGYQ